MAIYYQLTGLDHGEDFEEPREPEMNVDELFSNEEEAVNRFISLVRSIDCNAPGFVGYDDNGPWINELMLYKVISDDSEEDIPLKVWMRGRGTQDY